MASFVSYLPLRPNLSGSFSTTSFLSSKRVNPVVPRVRSSTLRRTMIVSQAGEKLAIMVNGMPGKMATATAEEVVRRGHILVEEALTGLGMDSSITVDGQVTVKLCSPDDHVACLQRARQKYPNVVLIDYTHPTAANPNVEKYAASGLSFVIGTTGGDSAAMRKAVESANGVYAVIAPNMSKQIVAFQAMMEMTAKEFPGAFSGYSLIVKESHQATKADTSGTAKAIVGSFINLGLDFDVNQIDKVRSADRSKREMGVPEEFITAGHAFHTYHLTSADESVNFEFQHNVSGRRTYAAGTVDAAQFLSARRKDGGDKRIFDMIDILRSGDMA